MSHRYDDLIHQPHHISSRRPRMPIRDRAAQFAPFAALTGYEEAIREAGRLTSKKIDLGEDQTAELNWKLQRLSSMLSQQPAVTLTYFRPGSEKDGGTYQTITGVVRAVRHHPGRLIMSSGLEISLTQLYDLDILG